jgi:hypothetical protein
VTGSGVVELATATLLAVPSSRRSGGWAAAALARQAPPIAVMLRVASGR